MLIFSPGKPVTFTALDSAIVMLLGGEPVGQRFIELNFVSSSIECIEQAKSDWQLPDLDHEEFMPLPGDAAPGSLQ
jgi:hypothetical protein